jgi:peptidoglycan/xylan/chitin deacetylase (PgdA/CDA1 family)
LVTIGFTAYRSGPAKGVPKKKMFFVLLAALANSALVFDIPSSSNLDMSAFPPTDVLAPLLDLNLLPYDFSLVPNIPLNSPPASIGPPTCPAVTTSLGTTGSCLWSCGTCSRTTDIATCPSAFKWGLTFDDGPSPYTPNLLDYLEGQEIRATFFVLGSRVKDRPQVLLRTFREGHHIGVHTWSHRALTTLSTPQVVAELEYTIRAIKQVIGTAPLYMRPPFGDIGKEFLNNVDDRVRAICKAMNLIPVIWDFDSGDFAYGSAASSLTPANFEKLFLDKATALSNQGTTGVLSLQHDLFQRTQEMAPGIIEQILTTKMIPQSVAECVRDFRPYADKSIVLPNSMVAFKGKSNSSLSMLMIIIIIAAGVLVLVAVGFGIWYFRRKRNSNPSKPSKDRLRNPIVRGPNV